jgi:methyl-accepting chemotaxis protein
MVTWLLDCRAATVEQRQTGRLVAGLLLIFLSVTIATALFYFIVGTQALTNVITFSATLLFLALYVINRRGGVVWASVSLIAIIMAIVPVSMLDPQIGVVSAALVPTILVIPVALAGILFSWRAVPVVAFIAVVEALVVFNWNGNALSSYAITFKTDVTGSQYLLVVVLTATSLLITFYSHQIRQTLRQLHTQNTMLAAQSMREHALINQMRAAVAYISSSAAEISAVAAQQAGGSREQASAITEVTTTVEELNQTAVQIAEAAASVAAAAEQALVSTNRGQEAVRDSIMSMALIKARVNDITTRILALSEQSQRISDVIDVINTIAAQTHILALNAAVESAGSGEMGQRFGVVAAEVKKLAQRSVAATKEVRGIVVQIQAATAAAVMATEEGLKETDHGVSLAHQSGDANDDIISMVERTAQLANAISLATQQQRTASEQVVATMREVAEVTQQAAGSSRQTLEAVNELSDAAHGLERIELYDEPHAPQGPLPPAPDAVAPRDRRTPVPA